jgi:NADH:ubiquinone oxidoreductase subunit 4 (subunit M)
LLVPAAAGAVVTAAFTLRALQKSFFASGHAADDPEPLSAITLPEKLGAVILMVSTLAIGLFPSVLLDPILRSFQSPLMHQLIREVAK